MFDLASEAMDDLVGFVFFLCVYGGLFICLCVCVSVSLSVCGCGECVSVSVCVFA